MNTEEDYDRTLFVFAFILFILSILSKKSGISQTLKYGNI